MKLDQKFFIPFMLVCGLISMVFIAISSFNHQANQEKVFFERVTISENLLTQNHPYLNQSDSLKLGQLKGYQTLVVFWASWSDKSRSMMMDIEAVQSDIDSLNVVAGLVKDATDPAIETLPDHPFIYIDGTRLFNELRVPGIPSYFLLDIDGKVTGIHVGYKDDLVKTITNQIQDE